MFPTGYGANSYTVAAPARPMNRQIPARNNQSRSSGGAFNGMLNGIVRAVADIGISDLLGSIFNN